MPKMYGDLDLVGNIATNLKDPTQPADAANKRYVDQQDAADRAYTDAAIASIPGAAPTIPGAGLVSLAGNQLDVGAGTGILVAADSVAVDMAALAADATLAGTYQVRSEKGTANGYASLDAGGLVPTNQLPPLAINNTFTAANEAAMLALTAQTGDMAVRADTGEVFVLQAEPASTLTNWVRISVPATVTTVNGQTGTVLLDAADVGAAAATTTITAGAGLTGGGDLTAARSFDVGAGTGITVTADAIAADMAAIAASTEITNAITAGAPPPVAGAGLTSATANTLDVGAGTGIVVAADAVSVDAAWLAGQITAGAPPPVGGAGLTATGSTLDVGAGTGITVAADTVSVDAAWLATQIDAASTSKYAQGGLTATAPQVITHNLNTTDVVVNFYDSAGVAIICDYAVSNATTITITSPPPAGARVVVIG